MIGRILPRPRQALFAALAILLPLTLAQAQAGIDVHLSSPTVDGFPSVTFYASVTDTAGERLDGLPGEAFQVLEDGLPVLQVAVEEARIGTRQVFVLNTSEGMYLRDPQGRTRLDLVRDTLLLWWQLPEAGTVGLDDMTLVTGDGTVVAHSPSAAELASTVDRLAPTFTGGVTDYDLLLQALEFAADPLPRPGMPNLLVFITPLIPLGQETTLQNAIARASQTGTIVFPVLVGPQELSDLPQVEGLSQLAEATGGTFHILDAAAGLTPLAQRLFNLRTLYQITYTSTASTSGSHSFQLRLSLENGEAQSDIRSFEIDVQPPEVAFLDPPTRITRKSQDTTVSVEVLPPTSQTLRLLVTFPDGHPRPLTSSQLIVDGQVIIQRAQEPFDVLEWDLSGYADSAAHTVRAVVEDSLGLEATTVHLSVLVEVAAPVRGLAALRSALGPLAAALAILIAGIVLALGLISRGRQRAAHEGPPIPALPRRAPLRRASLQKPNENQPAEAFLEPDGASQVGLDSIPITGADLILGRDASLCGVVLDDPSVEGMHARLIRQADGEYLLRDQGSVSGTWVNFEPVARHGRRLRHGDLVHIGRIAFRFRLATPPPPPEIRVRLDPSSQKTSVGPERGRRKRSPKDRKAGR